MVARRRNEKPRSHKAGAVQTPAESEPASAVAERLAPEIGEHFRPSAGLAAAARRVAEAAETPNGRGWVRLHELLELAAEDPEIRASLGASEFLAIVTVLAGDGVMDESASPRLRELYSLMSNRGGGRKPTFSAAKAKHLAKQGWPQADIANELGCDVRHVRRLLK